MYIKLSYSLNQTIIISLFTNPVVSKWFLRYSNFKYQQTYINTTAHSILKRLQPLIDPGYCNRYWKDILSTLENLKSLGYRVPFELPDKFSDDQQQLNRLHRFFTYNILWYRSSGVNCFDPTFQTNLGFKEWHDLLNKINIAVHCLEPATSGPNKKILNRLPLKYIWLQTENKSMDNSLQFDHDDRKHNFEYFNNHQHPLVLLDNSILGKSILDSFLDNDDPTLKDCSGRAVSNGGFIIDLNHSRSKIYQSTEFRTWCNKFCLTSPPLEFPIGYVMNPEKLGLVKILRLKKVEFLRSL